MIDFNPIPPCSSLSMPIDLMNSLHALTGSTVQRLAKLCVDSIDTLVRYLRENIKFSIKSLYFKYHNREFGKVVHIPVSI